MPPGSPTGPRAGPSRRGNSDQAIHAHIFVFAGSTRPGTSRTNSARLPVVSRMAPRADFLRARGSGFFLTRSGRDTGARKPVGVGRGRCGTLRSFRGLYGARSSSPPQDSSPMSPRVAHRPDPASIVSPRTHSPASKNSPSLSCQSSSRRAPSRAGSISTRKQIGRRWLLRGTRLVARPHGGSGWNSVSCVRNRISRHISRSLHLPVIHPRPFSCS